MIRYIDTHTHLFSKQFDSDREETVKRALAAGVDALLLPNIDAESLAPMLALAAAFPENCYPMIGLHPGSVEEDVEQQLAVHYEALQTNKAIAVGEIGIDLYWRQDNLEAQTHAFLTQCDWAIQMQLPVAIHSRDSLGYILSILGDKPLTGVFHCFSGNSEEATTIINRGMYVGLGGTLTYKSNQTLRDTVADIPLDRILLETDSPYLSPVPLRGKRNESSFIPLIAAQLAEIKGCSTLEIAAQTTANARKLFGI